MPIDSCDNSCWPSGDIHSFVEPAVSFFKDQRQLFDLDALIPTKGDRTSQWIMEEVDAITRQVFTGCTILIFILLIDGKFLCLAGNQFS